MEIGHDNRGGQSVRLQAFADAPKAESDYREHRCPNEGAQKSPLRLLLDFGLPRLVIHLCRPAHRNVRNLVFCYMVNSAMRRHVCWLVNFRLWLDGEARRLFTARGSASVFTVSDTGSLCVHVRVQCDTSTSTHTVASVFTVYSLNTYTRSYL